MNVAINQPRSIKALPAFTITSLIICLFLFYIDEGNYSLEGLTKTGNLVAMGIYFFFITIIQCISYILIPKKVSANKATLLSIFIGIPVGIFITISFLYFLRFLTM